MNPTELAAAISRTDKIVVYDGTPVISLDGRPASQPILYSSHKANDIATLKEAVAVTAPKEWFLCACAPIVDIALSQNGKEIGVVSVYEGLAIGFTGWDGNARPADQKRLLQWFDAHGISAPRRAVELQQEQLVEAEAAAKRWSQALPPPLRPAWKRALEVESAKIRLDPFKAMEAAADVMQPALEQQFPDRKARVRALFSWFGSGQGPWTGYPAYEDVPARLLLRYQLPDLLAALQEAPLTPAQLEGAARFFAGYNYGWAFKEPDDYSLIDQLPDGLKKALLAHVLKSADPDKVARARHAFQHQ